MKNVSSSGLNDCFRTGILFALIVFSMSFVSLLSCNDGNRGKQHVSATATQDAKQAKKSAEGDIRIPIQGSAEDMEEASRAMKENIASDHAIPNVVIKAGKPIEEIKKNIREAVQKGQRLQDCYQSRVFANPLLKYMKTDNQSVIAEVGCGSGALEVWFLLNKIQFKNLVASDIDPGSLELLQFLVDEYFPKESGRLKTVTALPSDSKLAENSFDVVVFHDAHYFLLDWYVYNEKTAVSSLKSVYRALKQGGRVYVFEFRSDYENYENQLTQKKTFEIISQNFLKAGFSIFKEGDFSNGYLFEEGYYLIVFTR